MKRRDQTKIEMTKRGRNKAKLSEADTEELSNLNNYDDNDQVKIIKPESGLTPNIKKDLHNIALLMFLYLLQGNFISILK